VQVRIKIAHTARPDIHDGLGGVHHHGDVVELPDEVAIAFVAGGFADLIGAGSYAKVTEASKAADDARALITRHASARVQQDLYDSLPPEVRALAREHGQAVVEEYLQGLPSMPLAEYLAHAGEPFADAHDAASAEVLPGLPHAAPDMPPAQKRRGRPPKIKPTPEGGDAA